MRNSVTKMKVNDIFMCFFVVTDDREKIEKFKKEFMRLGDAEEKQREQVKTLIEQVRVLQTENQELLDELKEKNDEIESYRYFSLFLIKKIFKHYKFQ